MYKNSHQLISPHDHHGVSEFFVLLPRFVLDLAEHVLRALQLQAFLPQLLLKIEPLAGSSRLSSGDAAAVLLLAQGFDDDTVVLDVFGGLFQMLRQVIDLPIPVF